MTTDTAALSESPSDIKINPPAPGTCPCCSGLAPTECCLPILEGKKEAKTAEEMLRARYTAFTRGDIEFILATHHSRTRAELKREDVEDWSKNSEWLGLRIVQIEAGKADDQKGTLVFCANFRAKGKLEEHWEQSIFEKEGGQWRFVDAHGVQAGPIRRSEPKIGRNDPCPCASGKKYKKCCGQ